MIIGRKLIKYKSADNKEQKAVDHEKNQTKNSLKKLIQHIKEVKPFSKDWVQQANHFQEILKIVRVLDDSSAQQQAAAEALKAGDPNDPFGEFPVPANFQPSTQNNQQFNQFFSESGQIFSPNVMANVANKNKKIGGSNNLVVIGGKKTGSSPSQPQAAPTQIMNQPTVSLQNEDGKAYLVAQIIEESKMSVLVSLAFNFKLQQRQELNINEIQDAIKKFQKDADAGHLIISYEEDLCEILTYCAKVVEVLQISDFSHIATLIHSLLETKLSFGDFQAPDKTGSLLDLVPDGSHSPISPVKGDTEKSGIPSFHKSLEYFAYEMIHSVFSNLEKLEEEKILRHFQKEDIFGLGIKFVSNHKNFFGPYEMKKALEALSLMAATEFFKTNVSSFVRKDDTELVEALQKLHKEVNFSTMKYDQKRLFRNLFETVEKGQQNQAQTSIQSQKTTTASNSNVQSSPQSSQASQSKPKGISSRFVMSSEF